MKISKNAFLFCKITITLIIWISFILKIKELVILAFMLLLLSAILKIRRAPLIYLYSSTMDKIIKSKKVELDESAMRFAHSLGSIFSGICVALLYMKQIIPSFDIRIAWAVVFFFAVTKTISALGYCPAEKVFTCMKNGCCNITSTKRPSSKND
ncbi:DUF4395 family protein [Candidatus Woesearchaeota archaeon]|nr:DUF4395 family protein [Candidatus Woesearchaeota archaeon]